MPVSDRFAQAVRAPSSGCISPCGRLFYARHERTNDHREESTRADMGTPVEFTTLAEMFERLSAAFAAEGRPMLMHKSGGAYRDISYAEFHDRAVCFANGLASLGVKRGDRVAVISENRPEWVIADSGMIRLGAVNVSIYPTLTPKQIEY